MAYKGGKWRTVTKGLTYGIGVDNQGGPDNVTVVGKTVRRRRLFGRGFVNKFIAKGEGIKIRDVKKTDSSGNTISNKKSTNYKGYNPGA